MKKISLFIVLLSIASQLSAQEVSKNLESEQLVTTIKHRIDSLEKAFNESIGEVRTTERNQTKAKYRESLQTIRTGIHNGTQIEILVPGITKLLAMKDLSETLTEINNPTSDILGVAFTDMVTESAADHLLPKYSSETENKTAKQKFSSVLGAIFNGPFAQSLINSNPISSTINAVIQQAGLFQKRTTTTTLSKEQLKSISNKTSASLSINLENPDGPAFGATEINNFNAAIQDRVNFYSELNEYNAEQKLVTQKLYNELGLIKKTLKASKTEICKLLEIDPDNIEPEIMAKYDIDNMDLETMRRYSNNPNFKKAIALSDYGKEQLSEVKLFNGMVVESLETYIEGYIKILTKHSDIKSAKLDKTEVEKQVKKLNEIKANLSELDKKP